MNLEYVVKDDGESINQILKSKLEISTRLLYKLIKGGYILVNEKKFDTRKNANIGDIITVNFNYVEDNSNIIPCEIKLDIVYEDEWILVVNKPAGISVHPSQLHYSDSLSNGVRFYFDKIGLKKKIRPVNRLDLNTSGLVVFAKCEYIQECLIRQMEKNQFQKEYLAICVGHFENKKGTINLPIARKPGSIMERCVSEDGQKSITHYEVLKEYENCSLVKCTLETGRTHQIRVHMSAVGHPLVNDTLYGINTNSELNGNNEHIGRQALHCYKIKFIHPISKENIELVAEFPEDLKNLQII